MEYIIIILILIAGYKLYEHLDKPKEVPIYAKPVPETPIESAIPDFPVKREVIMSDYLASLFEPKGGDPNEAQDVAKILATFADWGYMPMAIIVTCHRTGVSKQAIQKMLEVAGLNIPVYQGHTRYEEAKSEAGLWIIEESKKGKMYFHIGSPVCDLAWSMKNGAHNHNFYGWALLGTTWNAQDTRIDKGLPEWARRNMKAAADFVRKTLGSRLVEIKEPEYQKFLYVENLPVQYRDTDALIRDWRKYELWDYVNTPWVLQSNLQHNGSRYSTGKLRVADWVATLKRRGIPDHEAFSRAHHGFQILQERKVRGAKRTLPMMPDLPAMEESQSDFPVNKSSFNKDDVVIYIDPVDGGSRNPLSYPVTAKITSFILERNRYFLQHTKQKIWKGKPFDHRKIVGTDSFISFNRSIGKWVLAATEYAVEPNETRHKGWDYYDWILPGDPVGVVTSTNIRNGNYNVSGQANERSNIYWTVAK